MSVDTLTLARELRAADFASGQAEAIAAAIGRAVNETSATKADVVQQGTELRGELARLGSELRGELARLGSDLRGEVAKQGGELRVEIERSRNQLIMWFIATQLAIGGLVIAAIKLIPAQAV